MWKVLLGFVAHRTLLLAIVLVAVNVSLTSKLPSKAKLPRIESIGVLIREFKMQLDQLPEIDTARKMSLVSARAVFSEHHHPFFWLVRWFSEISGTSPAGAVIILSNLFFLLFLFETFIVLSSMVLLETAVWGTLLILFFPSTYEISLGSSLSFVLCLLAVAVRRALDNQWFVAGIALFLLALSDWVIIGWLPLFAGLFWFYQRHFQAAQVVKRLVFFLLPLTVAFALRWDWYRHAVPSMKGSALVGLISAPQMWLQEIASLHQLSGAGPVLSLLVFVVGAVLCLASHTTWLNRFIPFYSIAVVLAFSDVGNVTMRLLMAGTALAGVAHVASGTLARGLSLLFIVLTGTEIYRLFSGA